MTSRDPQATVKAKASSRSVRNLSEASEAMTRRELSAAIAGVKTGWAAFCERRGINRGRQGIAYGRRDA